MSEPQNSRFDREAPRGQGNPPHGSGAGLPVHVGHAPHAAMMPRQEIVYADSAPGAEPGEAAGASPELYLHALRRRWFSVAVLGCLGALGLAFLAYQIVRDRYTAMAILRVASTQQSIAFEGTERLPDFEIYKGTQEQYLRSRFVLTSALREPDVARLPAVREQLDPVAWLADNLRIAFPGEAEILTVSLSRENPEEARLLVDAVVNAYMNEVVNHELHQRRERLSELSEVLSNLEDEVRNKENQLAELAEAAGTTDRDALSLRQQMILGEFSEYRRQAFQFQVEILQIESQLRNKRARIADPEDVAVNEHELDTLVYADPWSHRILQRMIELQEIVSSSDHVARPGAAAPNVERHTSELKMLEERLAKRRAELRDVLVGRNRSTIEQEIAELEMQLAALQAQYKEVADDAHRAREQANVLGSRSIDVEIMRSEVEALRATRAVMTEERNKLNIEVRSRGRITIEQQAVVGNRPDRNQRLPLTVLAGLVGFAIPAAGITFVDVRSRRINTPQEVAQIVGLQVLGAVPEIPQRAIRHLASPSRTHRYWRSLMTESVDGIAARLLLAKSEEQARVILMASAIAGEGKTTLASQLALSLSRTGHKTLLVDFDLRHPSVCEAFGVPRTPGVSEVLRSESGLAECIHETPAGNLFVMTAGVRDQNSVRYLANGASDRLFAGLREHFDFVICDGMPLLPVAESRFVTQYVDGAVMAVRRDLSRTKQLVAACEILASLNVRCLGAVVTASPGDGYYYYYGGYSGRYGYASANRYQLEH